MIRLIPALNFLAIVASSVAIVVALAVFVKLDGQDSKINGNRVEQTRQGCMERNEERTIFRSQLYRQLAQTQALPESVFEQFGIPRSEALENIRGQIGELAPLDCEARVRAVRDSLD